MIPHFDPGTYPGPRPTGPVLVHDGRVHDLLVDGWTDAPFRLRTVTTPAERSARAALAASGPWRWSVAYGSNASPGRLVAKGLDRDGAVLLPARLAGHAPAFEQRRTGYGAVPLTLVPVVGVTHDTWVLGLRPDATRRLDRTEGRVPEGAPLHIDPEPADGRFAPPGTYQLARVGEVAVADRYVLRSGLAYLPGPAARVQVGDTGRWRTWPTWNQGDAAEHLRIGGPELPAPVVDDPVLGAWPATPLDDLPMFVYGTLRPDGSAWRRVADLVRVLGPATTSGTLYDSGHGWPAASFHDGPTTGAIRGYLLAPRDRGAAGALIHRADRYEGVPALFTRTSVLVDGPQGRGGWAVAYGWSAREPPGPPIGAGEWVVR